MMDFFDWLVSYLHLIGEFITNFFNSMKIVGQVLIGATSLPTQLLMYVPGIIGASITCVVGIGMAKLLIGWGNQ